MKTSTNTRTSASQFLVRVRVFNPDGDCVYKMMHWITEGTPIIAICRDLQFDPDHHAITVDDKRVRASYAPKPSQTVRIYRKHPQMFLGGYI